MNRLTYTEMHTNRVSSLTLICIEHHNLKLPCRLAMCSKKTPVPLPLPPSDATPWAGGGEVGGRPLEYVSTRSTLSHWDGPITDKALYATRPVSLEHTYSKTATGMYIYCTVSAKKNARFSKIIRFFKFKPMRVPDDFRSVFKLCS